MTENKPLKKDLVVQMFRENKTMLGAHIAEELGVSKQYVARILAEAGEDSAQRKKELMDLEYKKLEEKFREHYYDGVTGKQMEELLGIKKFGVQTLVKRTGLKFGDMVDKRKWWLVLDIKKLREEGKTLQEVANTLEVTIGYVMKLLRWSREELEADNVPEDILEELLKYTQEEEPQEEEEIIEEESQDEFGKSEEDKLEEGKEEEEGDKEDKEEK